MMLATFGIAERQAAQTLVELALDEDLRHTGDITSRAVIEESQTGTVSAVARAAGVICGGPLAALVMHALDQTVAIDIRSADGEVVQPGSVTAALSGRLRSLLAGERTVLNFLTHLSGVATLTRRYVDAIAGTGVTLFDTRKTLPGWRVLQKYAVRCGGGQNHRHGLHDAVLIKDNHLAALRESSGRPAIAVAVERARERTPPGTLVEVEVDTIAQLHEALPAAPDVILLDNLGLATLREAVKLRNGLAPEILLEASGGVTLDTVRSIAETGVDRISVGALTHSAPALDFAFDWEADR